MKTKAIFAGLVFAAGLVSTNAYAEPSFGEKDRSELYRVLRQQSRENRGERYAREPQYYYNNRADDRGSYEQYRPYDDGQRYETRRRNRYYGE